MPTASSSTDWYFLCWRDCRVHCLGMVLLDRNDIDSGHRLDIVSLYTFRCLGEAKCSCPAQDGLAWWNTHRLRLDIVYIRHHRFLACSTTVEDSLHLCPLYRRIVFASLRSLRRNIRRFPTAVTIITIQSPTHASSHRGSIRHLWLLGYLPPLRYFLHGKHHGRLAPSSRCMVRPHGSWRLYHIYIRWVRSTLASRNSTHHHCWYILDHRSVALRNRSRGCELLGIHIPLHGLRHGGNRYHLQRGKYFHHDFTSTKTARTGGCRNHAVTSSWNCGLSWIRGYCEYIHCRSTWSTEELSCCVLVRGRLRCYGTDYFGAFCENQKG